MWHRAGDCGELARQRYSVYLLYWYKSTNTDSLRLKGATFVCGDMLNDSLADAKVRTELKHTRGVTKPVNHIEQLR